MSNIKKLLATTMAFNSTYGDMFHTPTYKVKEVPLAPSDKQKNKSKELHTFTIKGIEIQAVSKKDAIKRYNHLKK